MFIRLTCLLCASLYGGMLIFGTGDPDAGQIAPVASRGIDAPATLPLMIGAAQASEAPATEPSMPEIESRVALTLPVKVATVPTPEVVARPIKVSVPDAPTEVLQTPGIEVVEITGRIVNLRAGPSTLTEVVTRLKRGERAEVVADDGNGWIRIRDLNSGTEGYMSADYLSLVTPG